MNKKRFPSTCLFILILCLAAGCTTHETTSTQDQENILTPIMVDQLNQLTVQLKPNPMNISDSELASLDVLGEAQVVGLGLAGKLFDRVFQRIEAGIDHNKRRNF